MFSIASFPHPENTLETHSVFSMCCVALRHAAREVAFSMQRIHLFCRGVLPKSVGFGVWNSGQEFASTFIAFILVSMAALATEIQENYC